MINGRTDFHYPMETSQLPLFRLLGVPPEHKRHAPLQGGHIPDNLHDLLARGARLVRSLPRAGAVISQTGMAYFDTQYTGLTGLWRTVTACVSERRVARQ